jgi:NAD(P)-dependent dehydrogenase (short-subunit alcohol dehydrogenase family)
MTTPKVALVTGASSGFGLLTAGRLAARGYRVFGTSRKKHPVAPEGVEMLVLNVQSDRSVQSCVQKVVSQASRIDLLVNNAGHAHAGVIEETGLEQAKDILETNFWGVVRVTNAVLPIMRQYRRGRIINVGSLAGLVAIPGQGFYTASKFALEGYTETLALEVGQFNIKVSLIEPGFFRTNLHKSMIQGTRTIVDYNALRTSVVSSIDESISRGDNPDKVADLIVKVAESDSLRLRYRVGSDAVWVPRVKAMVPERMFQDGTRRRFNLK